MHTDVAALLARLTSARVWPDDVTAMKAIRTAAEAGNHALSPLVPELLRRLEAGDEWSEDAAVRTLAAIGDPRAVDPLIDVLGRPGHELPDDLAPNADHAVLAHAQVAHDEDSLRASAARALGVLNDRRAVPALKAAIANPAEVDSVKSAARAAVALLDAAH